MIKAETAVAKKPAAKIVAAKAAAPVEAPVAKPTTHPAELRAGKHAGRYFEGVGRRKTATARVRITSGAPHAFVVNEKKLEDYFPLARLREAAVSPFTELKLAEKFSMSVRVSGGGIASQAGAVRMGLARALVKFDETLLKHLRLAGFLTRDSRMVERKKYGLKKARRAPQWAKR